LCRPQRHSQDMMTFLLIFWRADSDDMREINSTQSGGGGSARTPGCRMNQALEENMLSGKG
jgi:hypothetical protein